MQLSTNGRKLIQGFEGLSLKAYPDANGYSIGYGHFGAKPGDVISQAEAERLFDQDVIKYETAVSIATPNANQNQFDAMTSLAYNIGTAGFSNSTVARMHNMGDYASAADAFRMWNKSQGAVHPVLSVRREKERAYYLNGPGSPYSTPPMSTQSSSASNPAIPSKAAGAVQVLFGCAVAGGLIYFFARKQLNSLVAPLRG